jgi:polyisoprenoid-binding protein YceI
MSWLIDPTHSLIQFSANHMMISKVRGTFDNFSGTVNLDEENPSNTIVQVEIDAASINTRTAQRDDHLRSPDFLNAAEYPHLVFRGTGVTLKDQKHALLEGELTIREISHPVRLDVEFNGFSKSPYGTTSAGFSATGKINRKDWNLVWNQTLETGGMLVGDEIKIDIELELIKQ